MRATRLLHEYLRDSVEQYGDRLALAYGEDQYTYAAIARETVALAAWLREQGFKRGDRAALFMDNCAEQAVSMFGVSAAGGTFASIHGAARAPKVAHLLNNVQPKALIASHAKRNVVKQALESVGGANNLGILWIGTNSPPDVGARGFTWNELLNQCADTKVALDSICPEVSDSDLAFLIYTSGSTGASKGVMCPHSSVGFMIEGINRYLGHTQKDRLAVVLPLSFGYGMYQILTAFAAGASVHLERSFMFLHNVFRNMENTRTTGIAIVPTIAAMAFRMRDLNQYDFSSLRYITNAGAAMPLEMVRKTRKTWPKAKLFLMYGQTECQRISYLDPAEIDRHPNSAGKPMEGLHGWIANDNGNELPRGETGELRVRGEGLMAGYWNDTDLTDKVFVRNGRDEGRELRTGDLFLMNKDGYLFFQGRKTELIKTQGERVCPLEVENVILTLDGVTETAVVGVTDEILGQAVHAFVVHSKESSIDVDDVRKRCAEHLEPFMVPKEVTFIESLPRTLNGKINKLELVDGLGNQDGKS